MRSSLLAQLLLGVQGVERGAQADALLHHRALGGDLGAARTASLVEFDVGARRHKLIPRLRHLLQDRAVRGP